MDRINHVKIVTPDPAAIDRFLREVVDVPAGWSLGPLSDPPADVRGPARAADGGLTMDGIMAFRGAGTGGGLIAGDSESRQLQIFQADKPQIWGVAIGTRNLEQAHERCVAAGIPCTEPTLTAWGDAGIRFFFAEVGGIVFEVMRAEASGTE
ncbi:MAG TPA: VOC family protein [Acidimicrobiia bacterium]|jgi:hypothetical protein